MNHFIKMVLLGLTTFCVSSCGEIKKLQDQIDGINNTVGTGLDDASDVGVISENGWVAKMIRDSATGTPEQKKKARDDAKQLFGLTDADLRSVLFEVTVQVTGLGANADATVPVDVKFLEVVDNTVVANIFRNAPGSSWQPRDVSNVLPMLRTNDELRKRVKERAEALVPPYRCETIQLSMHAPGGPKRTKRCGFDWPGSERSADIKPMGGGMTAPDPEAAVRASRSNFVDALVGAILAPHDVYGLPPSGAPNGQVTLPYGMTAGATRYAVAFIPQSKVRSHSNIQLHGWLHVAGKPTSILGPGIQIPAVDFRERCLSLPPRYSDPRKNPTPPVDSISTAGPLCWYAFDLFGNAAAAQIDKLTQEARQRE